MPNHHVGARIVPSPRTSIRRGATRRRFTVRNGRLLLALLGRGRGDRRPRGRGRDPRVGGRLSNLIFSTFK